MTQITPAIDGRQVSLHQEETNTIHEIKSALGFNPDKPVPMNPAEVHLVDDLQDELMASRSPEGRPPNHDLRIAEWRWLALAVGVVLAGLLIWAIAQGLAAGWIVLGALFMICFIGVGSSPVLYAGLLRGREEHEARRTASAVVKHEASLTTRR